MALIPFLDEPLTYPIFAVIALGGSVFVGLLQGWILGKAVSARFVLVRRHAVPFSVGLLVLFLANAMISLPRFSSPDKIRLSTLFESAEPGAIADAFFTLLGVGTGFLAMFAISVTVISLVLLRMAPIRGAAKAFVIIISALAMVLTAASRLTYLSPNSLEVMLFFAYQLAIAAGIFIGTIRARPAAPAPRYK